MSKKPSAWRFNLEAVGKQQQGLKDPIGFKQSITDVVVRNSGKKNLTQLEVFENVHFSAFNILIIESLGVRKESVKADIDDIVYVLDDWYCHEYLDNNADNRFCDKPSKADVYGQLR
jgi:hypothetical protein